MSGLCVCIISDAKVVADSLAMSVAQYGHVTAIFSSTDELLASGQISQACAVVCNIMDGGARERELAHRAFEHAPKVPLYFIASTIFTRAALLSAPPNVTGIFDSPCNPEELLLAIDESCSCEPERSHARSLSEQN